uniref:Uncharacterized protein n=1 Tax=Anguilla anguilla TaxID=7936 RepID=A0A0E9Q9T7_ANGAN
MSGLLLIKSERQFVYMQARTTEQTCLLAGGVQCVEFGSLPVPGKPAANCCLQVSLRHMGFAVEC